MLCISCRGSWRLLSATRPATASRRAPSGLCPAPCSGLCPAAAAPSAPSRSPALLASRVLLASALADAISLREVDGPSLGYSWVDTLHHGRLVEEKAGIERLLALRRPLTKKLPYHETRPILRR